MPRQNGNRVCGGCEAKKAALTGGHRGAQGAVERRGGTQPAAAKGAVEPVPDDGQAAADASPAAKGAPLPSDRKRH